jgi:endonuclease/exonuclease/phosphatase family metal-dependent hydrolase
MFVRIRILQWNIHYKEDIRKIIAQIKRWNPDIVCLQELTQVCVHNDFQDTFELVKNTLHYHGYFALAHTYPSGEVGGNGIFSRYPLESTSTVMVQNATAQDDFSREGRSVAVASVVLPGASIKIATTHLSYTNRFEPTPRKKKEVKRLLDLMKKQKGQFIMTGDFNCTPSSEYVQEIMRVLKSAGPNFDLPTWTTKPFEYNGFKEDKLRWRLDYVFHTPDVKIISSEILQTSASDHLPILVTVDIADKK